MPTLSAAQAEFHPDTDEADLAPEPSQTSPSRRWDGELLVMSAMLRLLGDLSETARPRVVAWLADRFKEPQS